MRSVTRISTIILLLAISGLVCGQTFTHQDTLRGSITPERVWWDLSYYHLTVKVNPADSTLEGSNLINYKVLQSAQRIQIDLQPPLSITKVIQDGKSLEFTRDGNAYFIQLTKKQIKGAYNEMLVYYQGTPKLAPNPPWGGGLSWKFDPNGNPFVVTTCQGDGASLWWPCKDHQYDEPDSMLITVTVPEPLMDVSNGRLRSQVHHPDNTNTTEWFVANPINNYCVNMNIGVYVHFSEVYLGEKGNLDCDYYVLEENLDKAKVHFKEVPRMLEAFEHWYGPYPFYEDGYKLVEVPYTGMEHQSSVTYGNGYKNGYGGRDVSGTGWGSKFDFIIVHESGHEWFGNNITSKDMADMWVHEGFIAGSENLFVDYWYGTEASNAYAIGTRRSIRNRTPIIGPYNVNRAGSGDMYSKGANMLHTIRHLVADDEKWRGILRGLNRDFYHQTVTTEQVENYISDKTGMDLSLVFDQYLRDIRIPVLEYKVEGRTLKFRWTECIDGFNMPVRIMEDEESIWIKPLPTWSTIELPATHLTITVDPNFYILPKAID